jgi:hypothetical protein
MAKTAKRSARKPHQQGKRREIPPPIIPQSVQEQSISPKNKRSPLEPLILILLTLACLLPFSGRAFHVDDTLFVWTAQQITKSPLDPYGFRLNWDYTKRSMSDVTQNPPLASYYAAGVGAIFGWSERALHIAFLIPALLVILETYLLAQRFTDLPLLAAGVALLTPAMLVSSCSLMCDVMMLAFWVWSCNLWIEGLERNKPVLMISAAVLVGVCALTKYFGIALIPLLVVYSIMRKRRFERRTLWLLIPLAMLAGYELWTQNLYSQGLISHAAEFSSQMRTNAHASVLARTLGGLSFLGGSMLPALLFAPWLWKRLEILGGLVISVLMGLGLGWADYGAQAPRHAHWVLMTFELTLFIAAGLSIVGMVVKDLWRHRDANATLLSSWVIGTFAFAAYVNWTINVRSILPLIPAAAILIARTLESRNLRSERQWALRLAPALAAAAFLGLWVTVGDTVLANAGREAAAMMQQRFSGRRDKLWFEGHWGFQYYMEQAGFRPVDIQDLHLQGGDFLVISDNNYLTNKPDPKAIVSREVVELSLPWHIATIRQDLGAGWYSSAWGPVPFAFAPVPPETYEIYSLQSNQQ